MTRSAILLSAVALGVTAITATAQDAQAPAGPQGGRRMSPIVSALDTNKDGEIDATEIRNAPTALATLDKNGDGKLAGEEISPPRGGRGGQGGAGGGQGGAPGGQPKQ